MKEHTTAADLPTTEQIARERSRLRYKRRYGRTLRSTAAILLVVAALAVLVATLWMPVLRIYGSSMAPTLSDGQLVVAIKTYRRSRGLGRHRRGWNRFHQRKRPRRALSDGACVWRDDDHAALSGAGRAVFPDG